MKRHAKNQVISLTVIAAATMAAFAPAWGQEPSDEEKLAELSKPSSVVSLGVGLVNRDNQRFGQYTGMTDKGAYGLVDFDIVKREETTGTWTRAAGRNVGLDNRELRWEQNRQGDWGYAVEYSRIPRFSPYTVNTGLQGIGTNQQTITVAGKQDYQLKTERDIVTLTGDKWLGGGFIANIRYRNEDKNGSRLYGRGSSGQEFLAEPINYRTQQLEATLGYTGDQLQMSGAYYGTRFTNANTQLDVFGGTNSSTTSQTANFQTIGLPPDNQSHYGSLAGGYNFSPATRVMFKVARGRITQDDMFPQGFAVSGAVPSTVPLAPGVPSNLQGQIITTQGQLGLSSRLTSKLTLRADSRYEFRDDRTPIFTYLTGTTATSTNNGQNEPRSIKTRVSKIEASYLLPMGFRLTGGVEDELRERNVSAVRIVSTRKQTDEISYRAEVRRSLSETVNGSIGYVRSERTGTEWLLTTLNGGAAGSNLMYPMFLADRDRDKVRAVVNWMPLEALTVDFVAEYAKDNYTQRTVGLRDGSARLYSVDAGYAISEKWQTNAWVSSNDTRSHMLDCRASTTGAPNPAASNSFCPNTSTNEFWEADLQMLGDAFGVGVNGKPTGRIDVGLSVEYYRDRARQVITALSGAAPADEFPDITYRHTILRLQGRYALTRNSGIRAQYVFDRYNISDWTWSTYVFGQGTNPAATDGTTISQSPYQKVHFIGAAYYYEFR